MKKVKEISLKIIAFKLKIIKILLIVTVIGTIIIGSASFLFIYFFPKDSVLSLIEDTAIEVLHRRITVEELDYGFRGIELRGFVIHEGTEKDDPVLAKADSADLSISIPSLLNKEINITGITFNGLHLNIVFDKNDQSNLERLILEQVNSSSSTSSLKTKISFIRLNRCSLSLGNSPWYLQPLKGTYLIDTDVLFDNQNWINVKDCRLVLPDDRGILYPDLLIKPLENDFEITGNVDLKNTALPWVYKWKKGAWQPYNVVNARVSKLKINSTSVEGNVKGSCTLLNSSHKLKADGYCRVVYTPSTVYLAGIKGFIDDSPVKLDRLHFTTGGELIELDASVEGISVDYIKPLLFFLPFEKLYGKLSGSFKYAKGRYNADIKAMDAGYDKKNRIVSDINTRFMVKNNLIKKEGIQCKIFDQPCELSVAITDSALDDYLIRQIFINVSMKKFNPDLVPHDLYSKQSKKSEQGIKLPLVIQGSISLGELVYDKIISNNVNLNYSLKDQSVFIHNISADIMGGRIQGKGSIDLEPELSSVKTEITFNKLQMQDIAVLSSKFSSRFYGFASGNANLSFNITKDFYRTINGDVEFNIDKGKIVDTGIQNGLGIWLSELKYKLRDLEFKKIYGNIRIDGTRYNVRSFIFNSDDIRLKLSGEMNSKLITDGMTIDLEFSRRFLQDIPQAAVLLSLRKYQRGDWFFVPFMSTGDITESANLKLIQ